MQLKRVAIWFLACILLASLIAVWPIYDRMTRSAADAKAKIDIQLCLSKVMDESGLREFGATSEALQRATNMLAKEDSCGATREVIVNTKWPRTEDNWVLGTFYGGTWSVFTDEGNLSVRHQTPPNGRTIAVKRGP